jgi:TRAP-type uncharacterized transport system fused permease subunit
LITASKAKATSDEAAGYGWIMWVSQIGIVFGIMYLYFMYKALRYYSVVNLHSRIFALFAFMAILAVLSGQKHTNSWVFFMLMLTPLTFRFQTNWKDYKLSKPKYKFKKKREPTFVEKNKILRNK